MDLFKNEEHLSIVPHCDLEKCMLTSFLADKLIRFEITNYEFQWMKI